jgi:hypothetical protein
METNNHELSTNKCIFKGISTLWQVKIPYAEKTLATGRDL